MARTLLDGVREAVGRYALFADSDRVLVAISGGGDSVALLAALIALRDAFNISVVAGHLDHGLRGAESQADREFVERLAAQLGIALRVESVVLPPGNLEAEARRARYAFLERAADAMGATKIATAHTIDDQAETVLLRVLHGAGRRGLGGIRPRRGRIVRPLLLCDRVQVRYFLVERGLEWRRDRSNFDWAHARNRVRGGFLPALAREFNPRLARTLARLADLWREEDLLLDRLASAAGVIRAELDLDMLRMLDAPLARRAIRRWWARHGEARRLGLGHVERILALACRDQGGGSVRVPGGRVERGPAAFRFVAGDAPSRSDAAYELTLPVGGRVHAGEWTLSLTELDRDDAPPGDDRTCVIDAAEVPPVLTVRCRRTGDRLRPLGMDGHTTLKRLLIARRVPRALRATYPIVLAGDAILWVPGCARAVQALITAATRRVLVVRVERAPNDAPPAATRSDA